MVLFGTTSTSVAFAPSGLAVELKRLSGKLLLVVVLDTCGVQKGVLVVPLLGSMTVLLVFLDGFVLSLLSESDGDTVNSNRTFDVEDGRVLLVA